MSVGTILLIILVIALLGGFSALAEVVSMAAGPMSAAASALFW